MTDDDHGVPPHWVEHLCEVMHDAYERAAAESGWVTNTASRAAWDAVPEPNKVAMRAGVNALLADLFKPEARP